MRRVKLISDRRLRDFNVGTVLSCFAEKGPFRTSNNKGPAIHFGSQWLTLFIRRQGLYWNLLGRRRDHYTQRRLYVTDAD